MLRLKYFALSKAVLSLCLVSLFSILAANPAFASTSWYDGIVDNTGTAFLGSASDVTVDASGFMHVSYHDGTNETLKYATNASGEWVTTTVESTAGASPTLWLDATSIALDAAGNVYIAFADYYTYSVQYATNVTGRWVMHTVDTTSGTTLVGFYLSLAVDAADHLHISYYQNDWVSGDGALQYATDASGAWVLTQIDGGSGVDVGSYSSLALDTSDNVHISYRDETNGTLKYATNSLGSWVSLTADNAADVGRMTSLALDSSDKAHISYHDDDNEEIKYATNASGSWATSVVHATGALGYFSSIALDSSDHAHVAYYNDTSANVEYAENSSGSWDMSTVQNAMDSRIWNVAIAIDSADELSIVFGDDGDVKFATTQSQWSIEVLDDGDGDDVGQFVSVKYNYGAVGDQWQISYYDATNRDLKYMNTINTPETVDTTGDVGQYSSIAYDSLGYSHIAYYDATNMNLKYATNKTGAWVKTAIDTPGDMGQYASIAVDSADKVHIAYYNATGLDLKYATNKTGAWVKSTVDSVGIVGMHTSIAIDSADKIHISYNYAGDRLKYATNKTGAWVKTIVDNTRGVGTYTSIALDTADKAHISYYDELNTALKYVTNATGAWVKTTIDNSASVGKATSITLNNTDEIHISYHNATDSDLMHATNETGSWVTEVADAASTVESLVSIGGGIYQRQYDDAVVGKYSSIAAISGGTYIFYYDETAGDLRWAVAP